jgi:FkbM family methyltransferase
MRNPRWVRVCLARRRFRRSRLTEGRRIHHVKIGKVRLQIADGPDSLAALYVASELRGNRCQLDGIGFKPGDVIVDIGAHVGVFTCLLARAHPECRVLAFEPMPANYNNLCHNIEANRISNAVAVNCAVTADGRHLQMTYHPSNTGGATAKLNDLRLPGHHTFSVKSRTLDAIFAEYKIHECRLLKIDCEGMEHEILLNCHCLARIRSLRGEFHINRVLEGEGHSIDSLLSFCQRFIPEPNIKVDRIRMAE